MISTDIQLTEEQIQRLKLLASREQISTAELVRRAVDYWLQTTQVSPPLLTDEQRRRAIAAAGAFRSDVPDLAERHDDYLVEAFGDYEE